MAVRNIRKQLAGVEDLLLGKGKQDQERSAGIVSITKIAIPAIVETIDELSLVDINKYTTAIVKDLDRGGTFVYDSTKVAENNQGTIFNGWVRQYDGAVNAKWFGIKYGSNQYAEANKDILVSMDSSLSILFDMEEDLYIEPLSFNDNSIMFKGIEINSINNSTLYIQNTTNSTLFTIASDGYASIENINIEVGSAVCEVLTTKNNTDTKIKSININNCKITGYARFAIKANSDNLQNPNTFINGFDTLTFTNNYVSYSNDIGIWTINAMYQNMIIKNNTFRQAKGCYVFDAINNDSPNSLDISKYKRNLIVQGNTYLNDIDFDATGATGNSGYVAFVLTEGNYCEYSGNYVKNLQAWGTAGGGVYDIYHGGQYMNMHNNICINRFNFREEAKTNYSTNVGIKIKQTINAEVKDNTVDYEDGYFKYHLTQGRDYSDYLGDFFSMEQFEQGAGVRVLIDNNYIVSKVLNNSTRNGYFISNMTVKNNTFKSDSSGYTTIINARIDVDIYGGDDTLSKQYIVEGNTFYLPNVDMCSLLLAQPKGSNDHNAYFNVSRNSGVVKNLTMFSSNTGAGGGSFKGINISSNKFTCLGTKAAIIDEYAQIPELDSMLLENNSLIAPNVGTSCSPFGGVISSAKEFTASSTFITDGGYASGIKLDTITGYNSSFVVNSPTGVYVYELKVYDIDDTNSLGLGYSYDISFTYKIGVVGGITVATFKDSNNVDSSVNTNSNATNSVYVNTTAPNIGVYFTTTTTNNTMTLYLNRGIGGTGQTVRIDTKVTKIAL